MATLASVSGRLHASPCSLQAARHRRDTPLTSSFHGLSLNAAVDSPKYSTSSVKVAAVIAALPERQQVRCEACGRRDVLSGLAFSLAACSGAAEAASGRVAVAELIPTKGSSAKGKVTFTEQSGFFGGKKVNVDIDISGLSPGPHGFHIHDVGNVTCDDGMCTGGHYNPSKQPHGAPESKERHVGDLGNIIADQNGRVKTTLKDTVIALDGPQLDFGPLSCRSLWTGRPEVATLWECRRPSSVCNGEVDLGLTIAHLYSSKGAS